MPNIRPAMTLRHVFRLTNGETIICPREDARRVMDRRGQWEEPKVVWEVKTGLIWRRIWPEDLLSWTVEQR